jgi:flagellum-specific peptidoglycan hydrolase FlgJ
MSWWKWAVGAGVLVLLSRKASADVILDGIPENFVRAVREALGVVAPHLGTSAQQLVVAHGAFESGWGKSKPAQRGYNLFNVTRTPGDTRPVIESGDTECDAAGVCRPITQRFAAYGSLSEGLAEYFGLLSRKYGAALSALEIGDAAGFVTKLREGGYYTLPLADYRARFAGVLAGVKKRWG